MPSLVFSSVHTPYPTTKINSFFCQRVTRNLSTISGPSPRPWRFNLQFFALKKGQHCTQEKAQEHLSNWKVWSIISFFESSSWLVWYYMILVYVRSCFLRNEKMKTPPSRLSLWKTQGYLWKGCEHTQTRWDAVVLWIFAFKRSLQVTALQCNQWSLLHFVPCIPFHWDFFKGTMFLFEWYSGRNYEEPRFWS